MIFIQRSESEKIKLTEKGKQIGINDIIKSNKIICNSLKP